MKINKELTEDRKKDRTEYRNKEIDESRKKEWTEVRQSNI